jgi:hypothetical protein
MPPSRPRKRKASLRSQLPQTIAVGGPPSPGSILLIHIVTEIVRHLSGGVATFPVNSAEQFSSGHAGSQNWPLVLFFDVPERSVLKLIEANDFPLLLLEDDYFSTAVYCMTARNLAVAEASRFVSQSFACLDPVFRLERVRTISFAPQSDIVTFIDSVTTMMNIAGPVWNEMRTEFLSRYAHFKTVQEAVLGVVQFAEQAQAKAGQLPREMQELLREQARGFEGHVQHNAYWPAGILLEGRPPYGLVQGPIELVGPARLLAFGPYMHLPPGRWRAEYAFEAVVHGAGDLYGFDVTADSEVKFNTQGMIDRSGLYRIQCEFEIEDAASPVEFRCFLNEGAIGGYFEPKGVTLCRISSIG